LIPEPGQALTHLAGKIAMIVAPSIPTTYGATDAGLISMLLTMLAAEAELGIERRQQDAQGIKDIFESASQAPDPDDRARFIASEPATLSHPDVSTWLDQGLGLLIELHAWAEVEDPALNEKIWLFLYEHTERYKIDL
jgi:hypothetical protein